MQHDQLVVALPTRPSSLPGPDATVRDKLSELKFHEIDLTHGAVLEAGCVYLVPLIEQLNLRATIAAFANPQSSIGRVRDAALGKCTPEVGWVGGEAAIREGLNLRISLTPATPSGLVGYRARRY